MHTHTSDLSVFPFDARGVAKRFRHAAIFGALESLNHGERMRFVNDHDPLPLLDQLFEQALRSATPLLSNAPRSAAQQAAAAAPDATEVRLRAPTVLFTPEVSLPLPAASPNRSRSPTPPSTSPPRPRTW